MASQRFRIVPVGGLRTSVPQDDISLLKPVSEGTVVSHDVGGQNVDYQRTRNTCSKSCGYTPITTAPIANAVQCQGLFELWDGANRDLIVFYDGIGYYIHPDTGTPTRITPTDVEFSTTNFSFSMCQYGSYLIFTDGILTPYKWAHSYIDKGDFADKLIQKKRATEYIFKYLEVYQGRIIGAYTDQENGDIEIMWTENLPNLETLEFPSSNSQFKPGTDIITGIKRLGANACILYGETSINRIDYYPDVTNPFGIVTTIEHQGCACQSSIVALPDRHFLFNHDFGFIEYAGGVQFQPISLDIEDLINEIPWDWAQRIVGTFIPSSRECVWTIPGAVISRPAWLYYYDITNTRWRRSPRVMLWLDNWVVEDLSPTWTDEDTAYDTFTGIVTAGYNRWIDLFQRHKKLVYSGKDGHIYYEDTEAENTAAFSGYRIEPILDFGDPDRKDFLTQITFGLGNGGKWYIDVFWRGGETAHEVESATWHQVGSLYCDSPEKAVVYPWRVTGEPLTNRLHQIKWGTDGADEKFEVNHIEFYFEPQGPY
jgi:hypothetical protein